MPDDDAGWQAWFVSESKQADYLSPSRQVLYLDEDMTVDNED